MVGSMENLLNSNTWTNYNKKSKLEILLSVLNLYLMLIKKLTSASFVLRKHQYLTFKLEFVNKAVKPKN
jgi:hypothetical protein